MNKFPALVSDEGGKRTPNDIKCKSRQRGRTGMADTGRRGGPAESESTDEANRRQRVIQQPEHRQAGTDWPTELRAVLIAVFAVMLRASSNSPSSSKASQVGITPHLYDLAMPIEFAGMDK